MGKIPRIHAAFVTPTIRMSDESIHFKILPNTINKESLIKLAFITINKESLIKLAIITLSVTNAVSTDSQNIGLEKDICYK